MSLCVFRATSQIIRKRQQVYIDEENKQLLFSVAGTRSGTDIYNDLRLATGGLKNTNRFKSADKTLKDAKDYTPITLLLSWVQVLVVV
jgi:hypothetical protein